jgi:hypothetical protein
MEDYSLLLDLLISLIRKAGLGWKKRALFFLSVALFLAGFFVAFIAATEPYEDKQLMSHAKVLLVAAIALLAFVVIWIVGDAIQVINNERSLVRSIQTGPGDTALAVLDKLRMVGGLTGSASWLRMADLSHANLHAADLHDANLAMICLEFAQLQGANLRGANLRSARMQKSHLQGADLRGANLQYANLENADLRDAILCDTDMKAANLYRAYLRDANLRGASCDEHTVLPDGSKWTPNTDLCKFGAVMIEVQTPD